MERKAGGHRRVKASRPERRSVAAAGPRLPPGIDLAGQWSWRLLGVIGVLSVFGYVIATLKEIVVPFFIALLLTAFLRPLVNFLVHHRWRRGAAVLVSVLAASGVIAGLVTSLGLERGYEWGHLFVGSLISVVLVAVSGIVVLMVVGSGHRGRHEAAPS